MARPPNNAKKPSLKSPTTPQGHKTARTIVVCGTVLAALAMIVYAIQLLRDTGDPPWLTLLLAVFGPTGTVVVIFTIYLRYLTLGNADLNKRLSEMAEKEKNKGKKNGGDHST